MKKPLTVGVLFGGPSEEYEVSRKSAQTVMRGLREAGFEAVAIGIARHGRWYGPIEEADIADFDPVENAPGEVGMMPRPGGTVYRLFDLQPVCELDVVFPIIHGTYGEDGRLQGFLDMCRLPYVGAGVGASAIGMDKVYMRDIAKCHGIAQTDYAVVLRKRWQCEPESILDELQVKFARTDVFVKPANGGSSIGINRACNREELALALDEAARYDRKIMVERAIDKREIELAILGNENPVASLPGEILADQAFYDYHSKYESHASRTVCPADLDDMTREAVRQTGLRIYRALDMCGMCRVDFFIEKESGCLLFNEVNTLPGFTDISMYAQMWAASGKDLPTLCRELVELALAQRAEMDANVITRGGK